jgi:hypothetical protein
MAALGLVLPVAIAAAITGHVRAEALPALMLVYLVLVMFCTASSVLLGRVARGRNGSEG